LREQRLFSLAVLPIARKWHASLEDTYKTNYFVAIANMIEFMPASFFGSEESIDLMFIVVLEGSILRGADRAKEVYLKSLAQLNELFPEKAEDHLETITVRMTDPFIPNVIHGNVQCRILGLEVLTRLVKEHTGVSRKMSQNPRLASRLRATLPMALSDNTSRGVRKAAEQLRLALLLVE